MDSLEKQGTDLLLFQINKDGALGYLSYLPRLRKYIKKQRPDIIHAHYGLSGLLANLQRKVPVITTFHGSDLNNRKIVYLSRLAHMFSSASIFVEESMRKKVSRRGKSFTIPCGVDLFTFGSLPNDQENIPDSVQKNVVNILFSSSFSNPIKNYDLAKSACNLIEFSDLKINLIELKGYDRNEVNQLINAVDCLLLTSFSEGSPQIIKEAMACNCPIVSTVVGDVHKIIDGVEGCFFCSFEPNDVAEKIKLALTFSNEKGRTNGRLRIIELGFDSESIAERILKVYQEVLNG